MRCHDRFYRQKISVHMISIQIYYCERGYGLK